MTQEIRRLDYRVPHSDWAEVVSYPDGQTLALGHVKDISASGRSLDRPVCLAPGIRVRVNLSRVSPNGLFGHHHFTGRVIHAGTLGFGCVHGIKFSDMTPAEQTALTDYLCEVEYRTAS